MNTSGQNGSWSFTSTAWGITLGNGLIMQGNTLTNDTSSSDKTVTFNTPFPNACFFCIIKPNVNSSNNISARNWGHNITKTNFQYTQNLAGSLTWMAIGY